MTTHNAFLHQTALSVREVRRASVKADVVYLRAKRGWDDAQQALWNAQSHEREAVDAAERALQSYRLLSPKEIERLRKDNLRRFKACQKEVQNCYVNLRNAEVNLINAQLAVEISSLESLLKATLTVDDYLDIHTLMTSPQIPQYISPYTGAPPTKPDPKDYIPPQLTGIKKLIPTLKEIYRQEYAAARERYKQDFELYKQRVLSIQQRIRTSKENYRREVQKLREHAEIHNAAVVQFQAEFEAGQPKAIVDYFLFVLEASSYPDRFPQHAKLAFVPESKQLVVEYDLPPFNIVPEVGLYKYLKTKDEITRSNRPIVQRKALYSSVIAQVAIRTLHELFEADRLGHIGAIVFNGYVDSIDRGTGRKVRECVVTVRVTREVFLELDLNHVEPITCLKTLNAGVSKTPEELAPVKPVLELSMVDPRFIEETDVLSSLDQRPNLMELKPTEFEALIANLFEKMGLETRQTQASRDGGVDCVAYDPRPILGGKVVIQAKRYKNTVGVSAVRDLYGTLQNEGASKGILVTTSGYGKAAFDFASGKPLELLSGSNLLYLLETYADVQAKIVPPDDWKDPSADLGE